MYVDKKSKFNGPLIPAFWPIVAQQIFVHEDDAVVTYLLAPAIGAADLNHISLHVARRLSEVRLPYAVVVSVTQQDVTAVPPRNTAQAGDDT